MWRRRLTDFSFISMEAIALYVLAGLLAGAGRQPGPALACMLAAAFAGFGLARGLQRFDFPPRILVGLGASLSVVGLWILGSFAFTGSGGPQPIASVQSLGSDPAGALNRHWAEVGGLFLLAVAWLRGALAAIRPALSSRTVLSSFTIGMGIMMLGLVLGRNTVSAQAIPQATFPFFIAGLLALALLNLSQSEHIRGDSWRGPWLMVLVGSVAALAFVGDLFGLIPLGALNAALAPLDAVLFLVVDLLIYVIALPIVLVLNWLLVHLLQGHLHPVQIPALPPVNPARQLAHRTHPTGFALALLDVEHVIVLATVVAATAFVLWWVFRRVRRPEEMDGESREAVEHDLDLRAELRSALAALRNRFRPKPAVPEPDLSPRLRELRRLYLHALRRSAAKGLPRPPASTPKEFAPSMANRLESPDAEELSDRFSAGRYGRVEPSDRTLRDLHQRLGGPRVAQPRTPS